MVESVLRLGSSSLLRIGEYVYVGDMRNCKRCYKCNEIMLLDGHSCIENVHLVIKIRPDRVARQPRVSNRREDETVNCLSSPFMGPI